MNLKNKNRIDKYIGYIGTGIIIASIVWLFESGNPYGAWGIIIVSLIIAGVRLFKSWDAYISIIEYGASILRVMEKEHKEEKARRKNEKLKSKKSRKRFKTL